MAKRGSNHTQSSFSLRRIFLQRARISENQRNNRLNDVERGISSNDICEEIKSEGRKSTDSTNNKTEIQGSNPSLRNEDCIYCIICCFKETSTNPFHTLDLCGHKFCTSCLIKYLKNEISESRTDIACPQCSSTFHPNNIEYLLKNLPDIKNKYEDFMIRRYLVSDPDSRWCPAPDCSYAVIASGCASCPQLQCERPNCGVSFCYHCKAEWHPDQACDAARTSRQNALRTSSISFILDSARRDDIKPCPRCQVLIVKMNDGSCNHMVCSVCGAEFCWLCMKEVSDLHYLSPSGCTFWGKKPWSRKKKIVWQIGTLIGAPVGIALLAGIAVPSMVIGIPVWVGRKLLDRYKTKTKQKRNITVTLGVTASILISPFLAGLAIAIGVPILLFYVYGIVPVSLCRAGCATTTNEDYKFDVNVNDENRTQFKVERDSMDAISRVCETSLGDVSLSAGSGSIIEGCGDNNLAQSNRSPHENAQKAESSVDVATFGNESNRSSMYAKDATSATSAIVLAGSLTSCKQ